MKRIANPRSLPGTSGILTRVFTAEHLAVICLQAGRPKDHDRILRFVEAGILDSNRFERILENHQLMNAWQSFHERYLSQS